MTITELKKANVAAAVARIVAASPFRISSPWLSLEEAAARAKVAPSTIRRWATVGSLKSYQVKDGQHKTGITRFKVSDLDALLEGGARK